MTRLQRWLVLLLVAWELPVVLGIGARAVKVWSDETSYYDLTSRLVATGYDLPWRFVYAFALAPLMVWAVLTFGEGWAATGQFRLPTWFSRLFTARQTRS